MLREKRSSRVCAPNCECLCLPLYFSVCEHMSVCWCGRSSAAVYICVFVTVLQVVTLLTQTNQKRPLLLMPTFPRQRLPSRDGKSLPLCFSAFSPSIPSIL